MARPASLRSAPTTVTPSRSKRSATAWPIPLAAPVTTARLPDPVIVDSIPSGIQAPGGRWNSSTA